MNRTALAALVSLFVAMPAGATQQRSFVSFTGSDANGCTRTEPCRNFAAAVAQTTANGEVVVLDSAGYGVFAINQPVTIVSPLGVHAAVTVFSGTGVTVSAGPNEVVLRNLYINALGGSTGIELLSASSLHVEHCVLNGFLGNGITLTPSNPSGVSVSDTTARECGQSGLYVDGAIAANVSITNSRFFRNSYGIAADRAQIIVDRSVIDSNFTDGILARGTATSVNSPLVVTVNDSMISLNGTGIDAPLGRVAVHGGSMSANASYAIHALGTANVAVDGAHISGVPNSYCLATGAGGTLVVVNATIVGGDRGVFLYGSNPSLVELNHTSIMQNNVGVDCDSTFAIRSSGDNVIDGNTTNVDPICSFAAANKQ